MSGSCMVPRDHLLDLLDDLREGLPEEVQQAGAIVEQRTEILEQAQAEAERLTGRTRTEAEQAGRAPPGGSATSCIGTARRQRDELITQAQAEVEDLLVPAPRPRPTGSWPRPTGRPPSCWPTAGPSRPRWSPPGRPSTTG